LTPLFRFQKQYFLLTVLLLIVEIVIALVINDSFIRPYVGDFLVVILIYCFLQSFFIIPVVKASVAVLFFAYTIEILQYFSLVDKLGLEHNNILHVVLGSSFEWTDMLMYTLGILLVIFIEKR